jgi:DNA-binding transcriptional regulator YiaG
VIIKGINLRTLQNYETGHKRASGLAAVLFLIARDNPQLFKKRKRLLIIGLTNIKG